MLIKRMLRFSDIYSKITYYKWYIITVFLIETNNSLCMHGQSGMAI